MNIPITIFTFTITNIQKHIITNVKTIIVRVVMVPVFPFFVFSEPPIIAATKIEIMAIQDGVKRLFFTTLRPKNRLREVAILTKKGPKTALKTQKTAEKGQKNALSYP